MIVNLSAYMETSIPGTTLSDRITGDPNPSKPGTSLYAPGLIMANTGKKQDCSV